MKNTVIDSMLNEVGRDFDYRNREILFDRFSAWFDTIKFILDNDSYMGWKTYVSDCGTLVVDTATFGGGEWIRSVEHKTKANNPYNNFVNAIAYWDMLNDNGKKFFMQFYQKEFIALKQKINSDIESAKAKIVRLENEYQELSKEIDFLYPTSK